MQLAVLVVVVCAVSSAGAQSAVPGGLGWRLLAAVAFLAAAPLAALAFPDAAGERWSRRKTKTQPEIEKGFGDWQFLVTCLWLAGCLAVLYIAHWPDIVRGFSWSQAWPLVDDLLILAPLLASLNLVWVFSHGIEQRLQAANQAANAPPKMMLRQYLELRWRHYLGLTLLPALVILGIQETAARIQWIGGVDDARAWWLWACLVGGAVVSLPMLLRWVWHTQPVADSPLQRRLLESSRRMGCPVRHIMIWRTGGAVANAAVAGLIPAWRTIFLSDGLIARLNDDEIDVVVRHEAAHLARRHLWERLALLLVPLAAYGVIQTCRPEAFVRLQDGFTSFGIAPAIQISLLVPAAALAYSFVVVGWLARRHEHDADLAACLACPEGDAQSAPDGGEYTLDIHAAEQLHSALRKLVGDSSEYHRGGWFHPSVIERVEFLQRMAREPQLAARFRRRQRWLFWALAAWCAASVAVGNWPA